LVLHKKGSVSFTTKTTYVEESFHGRTRQQVVVVDENGTELTCGTNSVLELASHKRSVTKSGIYYTPARQKRILRWSGTEELIGTNILGVPHEIHILDTENSNIDWDLYFLSYNKEVGIEPENYTARHSAKGRKELCHLCTLASSYETPEHRWDRLKRDHKKFPRNTHYTSEIFRGLIECQGDFRNSYKNFVPNRRPEKVVKTDEYFEGIRKFRKKKQFKHFKHYK
jgi:hypothetical protein